MLKVAVFLGLLGICLAAVSHPNIIRRQLKIPESMKKLKNLNNLGIIGGQNTTIQKHPYQATIIKHGSFFCAGVIVGKKYVLTLADCFEGTTPDQYQVRVGSNSSNEGGTVYQVKALYVDPNYDDYTLSYDMGIMELNQTLKFGKNVKKVNLATKDLSAGKKVVLTGWGGEFSSNHPFKELTLGGVDRTLCNYTFSKYDYYVDSSMICAYASGAGPCDFDFGDPIVAKNRLYGIFSWAFGAAEDPFPGVYSSVPASLKFIKNIINS